MTSLSLYWWRKKEKRKWKNGWKEIWKPWKCKRKENVEWRRRMKIISRNIMNDLLLYYWRKKENVNDQKMEEKKYENLENEKEKKMWNDDVEKE